MAGMQQVLEHQLVHAAKVMESQIDAQITELDNMDSDDIENLRQKRLKEMKKLHDLRREWLHNDHGKYTEVQSERDFFEATKKSKNVVCHFFRPSTERCKIFDHHLEIMAPNHLKCRFIKIDAEKSPFLTKRLNIRVIPSLLIIKNDKTKGLVVGFDDLGGVDEFPTVMLEWRLGSFDVIHYDGDLLTAPWQPSHKTQKGIFYTGKSKHKRGNIHDDESDSDDENDW